MSFPRILLYLLPVLSLVAQTPPKPAEPPKPAAQPKPVDPTVSMSVVQPKEGALPDVPPDTVIVKIGEEKITAGEFSRLIETLPEQVRGQARGSGRKQLAENLVKLKLIAQEARRQKTDQESLFKVQAAYQLDNILAVYFLNNYMKTAKIPDAELHKYYDEHKADYESMRARHILIRFKGSRVPLKQDQKDLTEEEALARAQEIRKRLMVGADFAQVAKQESDDTGSAANGGSLGEFRHGAMVGPFDAAAGSLPLGEVSEPVKTPFGYHIIQVQARETKTFDEVKDEIEKKLRPQLTDKLIAELRTKTQVTMDEKYFDSAPPAIASPVQTTPITPK
jgi:peptidyl-prolyl cis-trans isomerase C